MATHATVDTTAPPPHEDEDDGAPHKVQNIATWVAARKHQDRVFAGKASYPTKILAPARSYASTSVLRFVCAMDVATAASFGTYAGAFCRLNSASSIVGIRCNGSGSGRRSMIRPFRWKTCSIKAAWQMFRSTVSGVAYVLDLAFVLAVTFAVLFTFAVVFAFAFLDFAVFFLDQGDPWTAATVGPQRMQSDGPGGRGRRPFGDVPAPQGLLLHPIDAYGGAVRRGRGHRMRDTPSAAAPPSADRDGPRGVGNGRSECRGACAASAPNGRTSPWGAP